LNRSHPHRFADSDEALHESATEEAEGPMPAIPDTSMMAGEADSFSGFVVEAALGLRATSVRVKEAERGPLAGRLASASEMVEVDLSAGAWAQSGDSSKSSMESAISPV
jgi:hypothetical protein